VRTVATHLSLSKDAPIPLAIAIAMPTTAEDDAYGEESTRGVLSILLGPF
jgi:hypothetical protein